MKIKKFRNASGVLALCLVLAVSSPGKAFAWGGVAQIPYLIRLITENVKRYQQLRMMINQARDHKNLLRQINKGIKNSFNLLRSIPINDERILAELENFEKAYKAVEKLYGSIPDSKESALQFLHDKSIAESIKMTNKARDYAKSQEENSILLEGQGRQASPKGAQRMQVEASSKMLHAIAQLIKINSQMLKLQSEQFALLNRKEKISVKTFQSADTQVKKSFKNYPAKFELPKFKQ